jgi:hypothetical protein
MSNRLKNIIKKGVNVLLEVDIADLPQKQVVKDKSAHDTGVAQATSDNITQKFRELGIDSSMDELATVALLKAKSPFNISFKLKETAKYKSSDGIEDEFFGGKTEVSGKATVIDKLSVDGKLSINFRDSNGSSNVSITFNPKELKNMRPETGQPMVIIRENVKYNTIIRNLDVGIKLPNGEYKDVNQDEVGVVGKFTGKSGKDYLVALNPKKQDNVKEGMVNMTIVKGSQINKSFVIPSNRFITDNTNHVYFPEKGKPLFVGKYDEDPEVNSIMIITSLPDIGNKGGSDDDGSNIRFSKTKPIPVSITISVDDVKKLSALQELSQGSLNNKLKNSKVTWSQSSKDMVLKSELSDGSVVMLKPNELYPNPEFLGNWVKLPVQIGKLAGGNKENWGGDDIMGVATIKLRK